MALVYKLNAGMDFAAISILALISL